MKKQSSIINKLRDDIGIANNDIDENDKKVKELQKKINNIQNELKLKKLDKKMVKNHINSNQTGS